MPRALAHAVREGKIGGSMGAGEEIVMMYWYGSSMSAWGYAFMTITMVLFLGLITAGIIALVRYLGRSGHSRDGESASSSGNISHQSSCWRSDLPAARLMRTSTCGG